MTTTNPNPKSATTTSSIVTYIDPAGVLYVLALTPGATSGDTEARVTQTRAGRSRVVATGSAAALTAMLATWAESEGGALAGDTEEDGSLGPG